jgi:alpha-glucosidase/alpha-D-xyloside xylohydrolase
MMRAMWLHYPDDENLRGLGTQYLWGRDILVAPVFTQGAVMREVYLPEGVWYDWWSGEKAIGSKTITRTVDLETMPIYVRAGAIIPFDPVRQYVMQSVSEPTTIRVYSGANGQFRWYEDDGISQEYLEGKFAWTNLKWDEVAKQLTIERDTTTGTLEQSARRLVVQLLPEGKSVEINYDGQRAQVIF